MGNILSKQQILDAKDIKVEEVEVPEWGGSVYIKVMNATQRDEFETFVYKRQDQGDLRGMRVLLCKLCICDAEGKQMFESTDDVKALTDKSGSALMVVFQAAQKLNALRKEDIGGIEENLKPDPSEDSTSD